MSNQISIRQIGPFTFQIDSPLADAVAFVRNTLVNVANVVVAPSTFAKIVGEYQFAGGEILVPFAVNFTELVENSILVELQFSDKEPEWRTNLIRMKIGTALYQPYSTDVELPAKRAETTPSDVPPPSETPARPKRSAQPTFDPPALLKTMTPPAKLSSSSDYGTTSAVGSFIAGTGWVGVAMSILLAFIIATSEGLIGFLVGS